MKDVKKDKDLNNENLNKFKVSNIKLIILIALTLLGLFFSLMLISKTLDLDLPFADALCKVGEYKVDNESGEPSPTRYTFNCELFMKYRLSKILNVEHSILATSIYIGFLLFFIIGMFLKERDRLSFLIIPFIVSIFNLVYSVFMIVNMYIIGPKVYCLLSTFIYVVNILIFAMLIVPYMKFLTEALKKIIQIPVYKNIYVIVPIIITIISLLLGVLFTYYPYLKQVKLTEADIEYIEQNISKAPYMLKTENSPKRGNGELGVEIVIFEDFQCPMCRILAGTVDQLMSYYNNKLSLVMKHYPLEPECFPIDIGTLHEYGCEASYASLAAKEQGKFWEYYDLLFSDRINNTEIFEKYAKRLNLDMEKFNEDYNSEKIKNKVMRDTIEGNQYRLTSTPTVFFNGFKYEGNRDLITLKKVVEYFKKYPNTRLNERNNDDGAEEKFDAEKYLSEKEYDIDTENSPVRGTNELGVEIIVYEDFECPACRSTAHELKKLLNHYDNKISLIFKHYPLESECFPLKGLKKHPNACEASYASLAAKEQGKFWEYYDLLFSKELDNTDVLKEYAKELNLDMEKFNEDYKSEELKKIIERDTNEGFKKLNVRSTPTLFFNNRLYKGYKEFEDLKKAVEYFIKQNNEK